MPKRQAEEIITREHGSAPNPAANSQASGTMSTPAQINRRPIKQPRSIRDRHRSTTPVGSGTNIAQQQSMVFQPPNQSFTFGNSSDTTASFPPSSASQFGGFGAGSTNSAASFTFGQSQPSTFNNPFTTSNSASNAHDNSMMDSSPQKPATSIFNFGTAAVQPQSVTTNGFTASQSQSQPAQSNLFGGVFGQQNNNTQQSVSSASNIFGGVSQPQTKENTSSSTTNMFSQSMNNNPFSFGKPPAQTPSTPSSLFAGFGQSQQPPATAPAPATKFVFGQTNVTDSPAQPVSKPSSLFGNLTSTTDAPSSAPSSTPLFRFGDTSTPKPQEEERPTSQQSSSSFGTFGSFTGFGNKPTDAPATPGGSLFGRVSAADTPAQSIEPADEPEQAPKPFAGFNFKPASGSADDSSKSKKALFSFGTPGETKEPDPSRSPSPTKSDSMPPTFTFSAPSTSTNSGGGLFSTASTLAATPSNLFAHLNTPASAGGPPTSSLFGAPTSTPTEHARKEVTHGTPNMFAAGGSAQPSHTATPSSTLGLQSPSISQDTQPATKSLANMFSAGSTTQSSNMFTSAATQEPLSMETSPSRKQAPAALAPTTSTTLPKSLFGNTFTPVKTTTSDAPAQINGPAHPVQPRLPQSSIPPPETVQRAVSTEGPPQIPRNLNASKYRSYDESWRLRALGRCFQKQMVDVDMTKMDPMNLIQNYLDHREAIGEGAGRYGRKKAGIKRKTDDVDDMQEEDVANKRAQISAPPIANTAKAASAVSFGSSTTGSALTPSPAASTGFSSVGQVSTTPKSSPAKPAPTNPFANMPLSASALADGQGSDRTSDLFKAMIPGATTSAGFTGSTLTGFKPTGFVPAAPKAAGFTPNLNSGSGGTTNFLSAFASSAAKEKEKIKAKRKAEEYDSDDSDADPDAWDSQYEAEQQAKRAKIESIAQKGIGFSFTPNGSVSPSRGGSSFTFGAAPTVNGVSSREDASGEDKENAIEVGNDTEDQEESGDAGDDEAEEPEEIDGQHEDEAEEEEEPEAQNAEDYTLQPGETSLFSRISGRGQEPTNTTGSETPVLQAPANNSFGPSTMFSNIGQSTPEQPTFSPFTPSTNKSPFKPAKAFTFTPRESAAPKDGSSIFSGATLKAGPIPGEGLFGSRPSTPSNEIEKVDRPALFSSHKSTTHEGEDYTWKPSTPIKFGSSEATGPAVQVQESTPPARNPFAGLFSNPSMAGSTAASTTNGASSLGFTFGQTSSAPAPSLLGVAPHLASTSRASSPGIPTDTESIATNLSEDRQDDPQTQLLTSGAKLSGEEDEDALYESRAAGMRYLDHKDPDTKAVSKKWIKYGSGVVKILKHKETGRTRILFRAEPGANVLLNVSANANIRYTAEKIGSNGALKFMVIEDIKGEKKITPWMLRVKTPALSEQMAEIMEREKTV